MTEEKSQHFLSLAANPALVLTLCLALGAQAVVLYSKVNSLEASRTVMVDAAHREADSIERAVEVQSAGMVQLQLEINELSRGCACPKN